MLKDWVVIIVSSFVFRSVVAQSQWVGYSVAFVGVAMYTRYKYVQYFEKQARQGGERDTLLGSSAGSRTTLREALSRDGSMFEDEDDDTTFLVSKEMPAAPQVSVHPWNLSPECVTNTGIAQSSRPKSKQPSPK